MRRRRQFASMATLVAAMLAGCSTARSLSPWGGFLDKDRPEGEFGASLGVGLPEESKPSVSDRIQSMLTRGEDASDSGAGGGSRTLPTVDAKTSALAQARLLERRGEFEAAKHAYQAYLQQYPQDPAPQHRLAVIAAQQGKFAEAEQHFHAAQSLAPPAPELLSDWGYLYYLMDRHGEAEAILRQALALDPHHESAHNNLGLVLGIQGKYDESLAEFKQCGSEAMAHANLAYVMTQRGELEEAQKRYLYALQLDSTLRPVGKAVLQLHERQQLAEQLAASRREEQAKLAARTAPLNSPQPPLAHLPPPQASNVEIVTRENPHHLPPQGPVAPASYQASSAGHPY